MCNLLLVPMLKCACEMCVTNLTCRSECRYANLNIVPQRTETIDASNTNLYMTRRPSGTSIIDLYRQRLPRVRYTLKDAPSNVTICVDNTRGACCVSTSPC